jgi:DMSO/TMAO reductase YedYZ molybdopterin-dependent catalytic subunit
MSRQNKDKCDTLPPGQRSIKSILKWGIDHPGIGRSIPKKDLGKWELVINGEVQKSMLLKWEDFLRLPKTEIVSNFHCVEGWSVLNCKWEGVKFNEIFKLVLPNGNAKAVTFGCADGYSTSLSINELSEDHVILAHRLDGKDLEEGLGGPMRLVVPDKYTYKSAMWINRISFTREKEKGYWESKGYSDSADVWKNDRYCF